MKISFEKTLPNEIEARSMEIITQEIGGFPLNPTNAPIVKRVIHTTADFDYLSNLIFSPHAVENGLKAIKAGATIVTDTKMAWSGVNKPALEAMGCSIQCFVADPDVAEAAKKNGTTRAVAAMEKAMSLPGPLIFAIGNAPTALIRLCEGIVEGRVNPALVIGVPVGFVNVVEAKEWLLTQTCSYIVAHGRKGGSNVAAAICNALLYEAGGRQL